MFEDTYPLLGAHTLLRQRKLETLRDYPRELFRIAHTSHSDGLLYGCDISIERDEICIEPGVLHYDGREYILHEPARVPYTASEEIRVVRVHFRSVETVDDCEVRVGDIGIDTHTDERDAEIELFRFKLKAGAYLRLDYQDFFDMDTEFDTVNLLYAPTASPGDATLHPWVTSRFAREALQYKLQHGVDYPFCQRCLDRESVPSNTIRAYLAQRTVAPCEAATLHEVYRELCRVYREIVRGERIGHARRMRERSILLE